MNPKIEKINAEIEKQQTRIVTAQTRIKELERQRTELENTDIIGIVRAVNATPEELAALLKTINGKGEHSHE
jgi:septal ring factor EnvC (AmiA/AmiB activator)